MRKRMTRRAKVQQESVDKEAIVAEELVKLAKALMAQEEGEEEEVPVEPEFNELRAQIKSKLNKFNKGLLNKRLMSLKGLTVGNQLLPKMKVMEVFELVNNILDL